MHLGSHETETLLVFIAIAIEIYISLDKMVRINRLLAIRLPILLPF